MSRRLTIVIIAAVLGLALALQTSVVLAQAPVQITINLVDELGNPLANYPPAGNVNNLRARYRYGGTWAPWQYFTTDGNGQFVVQIDPAHLSQWDGKVTVVLHQNSKEQSVTQQGRNIFQAARVNVNLKSCGQLVQEEPGGTVSQGGGYWYTHGTTGLAGRVTFYTFPGSVKLKMTYKGQSQTKESVPIASGTNEVDFLVPCIVINKTAVGGDGTFSYTATGTGLPTSFQITTSGGSGSQTFANLAPGSYTVTESALPPNWAFSSLACMDPDSGTTTTGPTANIDLDQGETVICSYTNTYTPPTGTIVIQKNAVPDDSQDFEFSRSFGDNFFLDDDSDGTLPNTVTFTGVATGTHTVTELGPPAGWTLTNLVCNDPDSGSTVDLSTRTATIDLDAGETVTCTFTNKTHDLVVTKTDDIDPAEINQVVTYTITVTNTGPSDAPNVIVTDTLPASGVTFVSATPSQGGPCTKVGNVVTCPLGTIASGNDATVTVTVRYTTTGTKTNTASASSTLPDLDTSNNLDEETTTVTQPSKPCPGVTFCSVPCWVTFKRVGERKLISVCVTNRSGAPIQVIEFEPQAGEPFTIVSVFPQLPVTIPNRRVRWFSVIVRGTAVAKARKPYFSITTSCGVVTTASDPRLLVPMHLESLQVAARSGHLHLKAHGEGIESVQLQLFDLSGRRLIDQESEGAILVTPLVNAKGHPLARGVYLYTVTVRGLDGTVVTSEVRKLAIKE